ncbi:MAG: hypothetical protein BWY82_02549 [Verrucomicrobia bacterium ADurb.Bin474]|nr:MAG: hypothetical protein BWY82_02549 [Verrucomicrobia bacterium ADurb.Bin474]
MVGLPFASDKNPGVIDLPVHHPALHITHNARTALVVEPIQHRLNPAWK